MKSGRPVHWHIAGRKHDNDQDSGHCREQKRIGFARLEIARQQVAISRKQSSQGNCSADTEDRAWCCKRGAVLYHQCAHLS